MNTLDKAKQYINENGKLTEHHSLFHLNPLCGWLNDPNGFSYYDGKYHLFFQFHPYKKEWGPMHWGHAVSDDLVSWEFLDTVMAPEDDFDINGCFSGTAVKIDNQHVLMYTGVDKDFNQIQCIASGDGLNYQKYENNPVIIGDGANIPELNDFRDPFIYKEDDKYKALICAMNEKGYGKIVEYESDDLYNWDYKKLVLEGNKDFGVMWECPAYVDFEEGGLLAWSIQNVCKNDLFNHSGNVSMYRLCNRYEDEYIFSESMGLLDYGMDFYAPQLLKLNDDRIVMTGWMQACSNGLIPEEVPYNGALTIVRELELKDNVLYQKPITELNDYRKDKVSIKTKLTAKESYNDISGRIIDLELKVSNFEDIIINMAEDKDYKMVLSYDKHNKKIVMDRSNTGIYLDIISRRETDLITEDLKLRIILDKYFLEVFINDGIKVMSCSFYTPLDIEGISFESKSGADIEIEKYELKKEKA